MSFWERGRCGKCLGKPSESYAGFSFVAVSYVRQRRCRGDGCPSSCAYLGTSFKECQTVAVHARSFDIFVTCRDS